VAGHPIGSEETVAVTRKTLLRVAELAKLTLPPDEVERLLSELSLIVEFVETLPDVPRSRRRPVEGPARTRADEVGETLTPGQALRNAPAQRDGFFEVPAFLPEAD